MILTIDFILWSRPKYSQMNRCALERELTSHWVLFCPPLASRCNSDKAI